MAGRIGWGLLGAAVLVGTVVMMSGGLSSLPGLSAGTPHAGSSALGASTNNSTNTFNFSAPGHPKWNTGNLCSIERVGSNETCKFPGGGPHVKSGNLIENFSGQHLNIYLKISGMNKFRDHLYLNFQGEWDNITVRLSNGYWNDVNITVLTQDMTLNLTYTGSHITTGVVFYTDHDTYNMDDHGSHDATTTYFVGARPHSNECPAGTMSNTDRYTVMIHGSFNSQQLIWVNAAGYSTPMNTESFGSGHADTLGWENSTSFVCGWSLPPVSAGSNHGNGGAVEGIASNREP